MILEYIWLDSEQKCRSKTKILKNSRNIDFTNMEINFNSPTSQWWTQLSNAMVFGVMFSFILTLIITPCLIIIGEKSKFLKTL